MKTGRCRFKEDKGWCGFAHVKGPARLQNIEGMVLEDIAGACVWNGDCWEVKREDAIPKSLEEVVSAEIAEIMEKDESDSEEVYHMPKVPTLGEFMPRASTLGEHHPTSVFSRRR